MQIIDEGMDKQISDYAATLPMPEAKRLYTAYKNKELNMPFRVPDENKTERRVLGAVQGVVQKLEVVPEGIGIVGGQVDIYLGSMFKAIPLSLSEVYGKEFVKAGELLIDAANSSLEAKRKRQAQEQLPLTEEDVQSPLYKATATGLDYTIQIALGLLTGPAAALALMGVREQAETSVEGLEKYKQEHPEDKSLSGYKEFGNISKELLLSSAKTGVNLYVEKALGIPEQMSRFKKAIKTPSVGLIGMGKAAAKGFALGYGEEWATETIQGITDTTFDAFLGRMKDLPDLFDAYKQAVGDAVYAGLFGGGFGASGHVLARGKAIGHVKQALSNVVPAEDLNNIATAIVDNHITETKTMITTQIALSTQLRDKHGAIFNAMNVAAKQAMMSSGVTRTMTEDEIAQHSTELATLFADQVLAEANKRNVPIMDVIQDKDIVYDPVKKELRLAPPKQERTTQKIEEKKKKIREKKKQVAEGIKTPEEIALERKKEDTDITDLEEIERDNLDALRMIAFRVADDIDAEFGDMETDFLDLAQVVGDESSLNDNMHMALMMAIPEGYETDDYQIQKKKEIFEEFGKRLAYEPGVYKDYAQIGFDEYMNRVREAWDRSVLRRDLPVFLQGKIADNNGNVELSINTAEEMKDMSEEDFKQKMLETLWSFKNDKIHNDSLGADIEIRTVSIKKYKSFFADKNKRFIVPYIPELLKKANFSKKEKPYNQSKEKNIKAYYKADIGISIDKENYNVHLTVKEDDKGNFFWDAQVKENDRRTVSATNPSVGGQSDKSLSDSLIITPSDANVKTYLQEGEDKNLVVYHNISKDNLLKAMKLGGLPVPSLAITRYDIPFTRFGEISLVGNKEIIDPRDQRNEVFNRDVWTKTFHETEYRKPREAKIKKFKEKYEKFFDKAGDKSALSSFLYSLTFSPARAESEISNSLGMKLAYIEMALGKKVEIPKKDFGKSILIENEIDEQFVENVKDISSDGDNEKLKREVTKAYREMLSRKDYSKFGKYAEKMKDIDQTNKNVFDENGILYFAKADTLWYAAKKYENAKGKDVIDDTALRQKIDDTIKDKQEYRKWARNQLEKDLLGEPMIEVGRGLKPMTLGNIVDAMTSGETKNSQNSLIYGSGKVIAAGAKKLESIADIKLESNKFVSAEEEEEIHDKLNKDIYSFAEDVLKEARTPYSFNAMEAANMALGHIASLKNPTIEALQKSLNIETGEKHIYSKELLKRGVKVAEEVKGLVRHYFEAKPQRAVGIGEFSGAIVPTNAEFDSISKTLEDIGLKVVRSDNQTEAVKQFENVFFQKESKAKGMFDANSKVIKLFENADASTLDHELAHFWLDNMWTYATSGAASEVYKAQFQAVKDFLGVKPDQKYLTYNQHEKFASAYEKYIHRGIIPNSIMGNVFDNYERFIRNVYNSINDIYASTEQHKKRAFKLTPEIIKFFDSMIKGGVDVQAIEGNMAVEARNEEAQKADDTTMKESKDVVEKEPVREVLPEIAPVRVEGKTKESRLFNRLKSVAGAEGAVEYNVVNIREQREKASKMWKENPEKARAILKGTEQADDVLRQALYTEQQRLALENGDTNTFLSSLRKQTAEATRMGQELSALRGVAEDITDPAYWIRSAETEALKNLAKKQTKNLENAVGNSPLMELTARLDKEIKALQKEVMGKETDEEKMKALKEGVKSIAEKYQGLEQPDTVFNQVDWDNEDFANDYIENKVKEKLGIALPKETAKAFIQTARDLDALSKQRYEFGNPVEAFFVKKDELERMRNSHTPTSRTKILISTIGRGNMLTAPSTSVLNAVSNTQNYFVENVVRKVANILEGKTNDNIVDQDLMNKYRGIAWRTFWDTGYDMSFMTSLLDERLYKGESVSHSEGEGWIRGLGRWTEKYVFSRLISSPDIYFKSVLGFTNYVGNEATNIAYQEGLTGDKAKARANELFKDAIKIEPETDLGKQIRLKAQTDALILTFQQDSKFAEMLLKVRDAINKGTGDIGIGDIMSPFIKTPANILSMSFDAAVGPFASPVNLLGALTDIKNKNYKSARVMQAAKQTTTAALAYVVIGLLASMLIDDDDYIPDYAQLTPKERAIVRARGGSYGSIKVGDKYISTDFFGTFEMPLVTFLNARRTGNLLKGIAGGVGAKFVDAPVLKDILGSSDAIKEMATSKDDIISAIGENAANAAISRLTPNALNAVAKVIDDKDRKINTVMDKVISRIPFARQTLDEKLNVTTGQAQELGRINTLLFGSRGKNAETNALARELGRLANEGEVVNITDPTKSGDLAKLDKAEKLKIQDMFAVEFAKKAGRLIGTASYSNKSDENKKEALNKVRSDVISEIKRKYRKEIKNTERKGVVRKK